MRPGRRVILRSTRDEDGSRHLDAHLTAAGDLLIEGQDLGRGVERAFGDGLTEYEWSHTVRAGDVPLLVAALGGEPGDDILELLERAARATARRGWPPCWDPTARSPRSSGAG